MIGGGSNGNGRNPFNNNNGRNPFAGQNGRNPFNAPNARKRPQNWDQLDQPAKSRRDNGRNSDRNGRFSEPAFIIRFMGSDVTMTRRNLKELYETLDKNEMYYGRCFPNEGRLSLNGIEIPCILRCDKWLLELQGHFLKNCPIRGVATRDRRFAWLGVCKICHQNKNPTIDHQCAQRMPCKSCKSHGIRNTRPWLHTTDMCPWQIGTAQERYDTWMNVWHRHPIYFEFTLDELAMDERPSIEEINAKRVEFDMPPLSPEQFEARDRLWPNAATAQDNGEHSSNVSENSDEVEETLDLNNLQIQDKNPADHQTQDKNPADQIKDSLAKANQLLLIGEMDEKTNACLIALNIQAKKGKLDTWDAVEEVLSVCATPHYQIHPTDPPHRGDLDYAEYERLAKALDIERFVITPPQNEPPKEPENTDREKKDDVDMSDGELD